jgi:hypothetical protein
MNADHFDLESSVTSQGTNDSYNNAGVRIYNSVVRPDNTPDVISSLKADEVLIS